MSNETVKLQSWQVFQAARKFIGAERVAKIFNREKRSAYSWAQDPAFTEHRCKNPLDLLHNLFVELDARGLGYVARDAIAYLSTAVDDFDCKSVAEPLPTLDAELLADFSALADFKSAIDEGESAEVIRKIKQDVIAELDRTEARYIADNKKE